MVENFSRNFLTEQLDLDEHPVDPCVFILREPSSRGSKVHDGGVTTLSGVVGPPGSLCGILGVHVDDQVTGGRGTRWENVVKRLRARFPFRKWIHGRGEFTFSWLEQQPQSQETYATGAKPA